MKKQKPDALDILSDMYVCCGRAISRKEAQEETERLHLVREQVFRKTHQK